MKRSDRRRPDLERAPARARELGDLARDADHPPRRRAGRDEAPHRLVRPLSGPPGRLRRTTAATWTPLAPAGDWGGIVVMSALVELRPFGRGRYMAMFHDDGRFFAKEAAPGEAARLHPLCDVLGGRRPDLVLPARRSTRRPRSTSASRGSSARPTAGPWPRSCARTAGPATRSSSSRTTRARPGLRRASCRARSPATATPASTPRTAASSSPSAT